MLGVAALLVLRALLPELARWAIESRGGEALGREIRLGRVDLELLRGRATLRDLHVGAEPDRAPLASVERLSVDLAWADLLRGDAAVEAIAIAGPHVTLQRGADGALEPLAPATADDEAEPAAAEASSPPPELRLARLTLERAALDLIDARGEVELAVGLGRLSIGEIALAGGALSIGPVELSDPRVRARRPGPAAGSDVEPASGDTTAATPGDSAGLPWSIASIEIEGGLLELLDPDAVFPVRIGASARELRADAGHRFPVEIDLGVAGGRVRLAGQLGLDPLSYSGSLGWEDLRLDALLVIVEAPPVEIDSGRTHADLEVGLEIGSAGVPDTPRHLSVSGALGVSELRLGTRDAALDLALEGLEVGIAKVDVPLDGAAPSVHLERVALARPRIGLRRTPSGETAPPPAGDAETSDEPAALRLRVDELAVAGGALVLDDRTLEPAARTEVREIAAGAKEIEWPQPRAREASLIARLGSGELSAKGAMGHGGDRLELRVQRLSLRHLSPYTRPLGYELLGGQAGASTDVLWEDGSIRADTEVEIERLDVRGGGTAFRESFGVPLDLAIALLQDSHHRIRLQVPLSADAHGSRVQLGRTLQSALRQSLVGALSSPLKTLGALAEGAGGLVGIRAPQIDFAAGSAELSPERDETLARLAATLAEHPALALDLHGSTGDEDAGARPADTSLADARADAVRARLVEVHGADADRVQLAAPEHQGTHVRAALTPVRTDRPDAGAPP